MKKLLALLILLVGVFALAACGGDNGDDDPIDEETDADRVSEAVDRSGALFVDTGNMTEGMTLPGTIMGDVTVTWASGDEDYAVISDRDTGYYLVILRPAYGEDDANVTVTATFTKGDATETREWTLTIIAEPESDPYNNIADLHEGSESSDVVAISGIVVALYNGGYIITDGTNYLNIFSSNDGLNPGDLVRVIGSYSNYHTTYQLSNASTALLDINQEYELNPTDILLNDLDDIDASDPLIGAKPYRVKGLVQQQGSNWFLSHAGLSLQVYGYSQNDSLEYFKEYDGDAIEVTVFYYTDHSRDGVLLMVYEPAMDVVVLDELPQFDPSELLEIAKTALKIDYPSMIIEDLELPLTGIEGSTITWSSDDTDVVANDGTVTRQATDTTVTLTATITINDSSVTKDFVLTVKATDVEPMTIAEALAAEDGDIVYIKGVVNAYREHNDGVFIEDANGDIIHVLDIVAEAGNEIVVIGTRDTYDLHGNNRPQVSSPVLVSNDEGDNPYTVVDTFTMAEIADAFPGNTGTRYRVQNVEFLGFGTGDGSDEVQFLANGDVYIFFDARNYGDSDALEALADGSIIDFIEFTVADMSWDNIRVDGVELPTDLMPTEPEPSDPDLFISEYIDWTSGNNKALEIFNGTGETVDLTLYSIVTYNNGETDPTNTYDLTGTLADGEVFVIAHADASQELKAVADVELSWPSVLGFNGDDAITLVKDGVIIDIIGVIGERPDPGWAAGDDGNTSDHVLVRKSSVTGPNATYDPTEWETYIDDSTHLGNHTMD